MIVENIRGVLVEHYTYLKEKSEFLFNEINYLKDLIDLNISHKRSNTANEKKLFILNIEYKKVHSILSDFERLLKKYDIDIGKAFSKEGGE